MHDIEDQLRSYGEAFETHFLDGSQLPARSPSRRVLAAVAAVVVLAGAGVAVLLTRGAGDENGVVSTEPTAPAGPADDAVFATPTNVVLLFSDGIDGATAVDLDRGVAGRRVIDGERAGDQSFRLTLTGDHLVVGWGEIYADPLDGGPSRKIADATIYVPASEPGEVWTLTWDGGAIGAGPSTIARVRVDGTVAYGPASIDLTNSSAVIGVPGGLAFDTPKASRCGTPTRGAFGPVLGPGPVTAASSDGRSLAWCQSTCDTVHVVDLDHTGPPPAPHAAVSQQVALSPDGSRLAVLRPTDPSPDPADTGADLVVTDWQNSVETVVAHNLDESDTLHWTADGRQLFVTEYSYGDQSMRIGRFDTDTRLWEIQTVPFGAGLGAAVVDRDQARSFFSTPLVPESECPGGGGSYPSGRTGVCTFQFSTSTAAQRCETDGPRTIDVPDVVGLPLTDAITRIAPPASTSSAPARPTVTRPGRPPSFDPRNPPPAPSCPRPPASASNRYLTVTGRASRRWPRGFADSVSCGSPGLQTATVWLRGTGPGPGAGTVTITRRPSRDHPKSANRRVILTGKPGTCCQVRSSRSSTQRSLLSGWK